MAVFEGSDELTKEPNRRFLFIEVGIQKYIEDDRMHPFASVVEIGSIISDEFGQYFLEVGAIVCNVGRVDDGLEELNN